MSSLTKFLSTLHYEARDKSLITQALTHKSFSAQHNERLEFLGDALLGSCIAEALYHKLPNINEGKLSRFRAELVKGETLARVATDIGLIQQLKLGKSEKKNISTSILADAFEALIAAIYLDSNYVQCQAVVNHIFSQRIDNIETSAALKDAKTQLQELLQSHKLALPNYTLIKATGPEHRQEFFVACSIPNTNKHVESQGNTKKAAEQNAAKSMLSLLQEQSS